MCQPNDPIPETRDPLSPAPVEPSSAAAWPGAAGQVRDMGNNRGAGMPRRTRLMLCLAAMTPLVLIGIAGALRPSAAGLGTHQQLGLPPCSSRLLWGTRCPACGMTTSWSHFARGQWASSLAANTGGFLLAVYCITGAAIGLTAAWRGRWPPAGWQAAMAWGAIAVLLVTLVDWASRLWS